MYMYMCMDVYVCMRIVLMQKNLENAMKSAPTATPGTTVVPEPSDESQAEVRPCKYTRWMHAVHIW